MASQCTRVLHDFATGFLHTWNNARPLLPRLLLERMNIALQQGTQRELTTMTSVPTGSEVYMSTIVGRDTNRACTEGVHGLEYSTTAIGSNRYINFKQRRRRRSGSITRQMTIKSGGTICKCGQYTRSFKSWSHGMSVRLIN